MEGKNFLIDQPVLIILRKTNDLILDVIIEFQLIQNQFCIVKVGGDGESLIQLIKGLPTLLIPVGDMLYVIASVNGTGVCYPSGDDLLIILFCFTMLEPLDLYPEATYIIPGGNVYYVWMSISDPHGTM